MWRVGLAALVLLAVFVAGWKANGWKHAYDREQAALAQREALNAVAKEIAAIEVQNKTIHQKVVQHVIEKPVYRDCQHGADTFRLLNNALAGQPLDGDPELPKNPD